MSTEEARLLGMSAERECALRAKIERLERENAALREEIKDAGMKALSVALQAYTRDLQDLKAENAALRKAGNTAEESIARYTDQIIHLEMNAEELEHTIENLRSTLWGTEFELEKAKQEIERLRAVLSCYKP